MEKLNKRIEEENTTLKVDKEKLTAEVNKISEDKLALLKQVEKLKEEVQKAQEKQTNDIRTALDKEIQDEKAKQEKEIEKLKKENIVLVEKVEKLTTQLEETRIALEKDLDDLKAEADKEKSATITKAIEFQNLIKENEKLLLNLQATKKHNHILLGENSRMHSELPDMYEKVTQLKEDIQKLQKNFCQHSQEFIHEFIQKVTPLKQSIEENVVLKNKACQDCSSVVCANADIARKVNTLSLENECLKRNRNHHNRQRYPSSPADFRY